MARRCTTVPGIGTCCRAAEQGLLGRVMRIASSSGRERCAICTTHQSTSNNPAKRGRMVFQFRFVKNSDPACGIGPSGCPFLQPGGAPGGQQLLLR